MTQTNWNTPEQLHLSIRQPDGNSSNDDRARGKQAKSVIGFRFRRGARKAASGQTFLAR